MNYYISTKTLFIYMLFIHLNKTKAESKSPRAVRDYIQFYNSL